jgi:hypothetical protein
VVVAALVLAPITMKAVGSVRGHLEVAGLTAQMKSICVGRFLIDVPATADVSLKNVFLDGIDVSRRVESSNAFMARLASRQEQLQSSLESASEVGMKGSIGKVFMHGRGRTYRVENDRRVYTDFLAVDGYVNSNGVSYDLSAQRYDPERAGNIARLMTQLATRAQEEIPAEPGFCIDQAFIRDPSGVGAAETVTMFASLPGHPDLGIVFSTLAGTKGGPGLLERNAAAAAREPLRARAGVSTLYQGQRTINGLPGEELVLKAREANLTTGFSFDWEMGGRQDDVNAPLLMLELAAGTNPRPGGKPVQSSLSESGLVNLWDSISSSIRLRPANPTRPAQASPASTFERASAPRLAPAGVRPAT